MVSPEQRQSARPTLAIDVGGGTEEILLWQLDIPLDHRKAADWQVRVWHPEGRMQYVVSAGGTEKDFR